MAEALATVARKTDEATAVARAELVAAVRAAWASGMTQADIGRAIRRSQPEVSRLIHFHGTTPLGHRLRRAVPEVKRIVADFGGTNLRVFGSVATGVDSDGSDVDLLFSLGRPLGLFDLGRLERELEEVIGAPVDAVPETSLNPVVRDRVLAEAVPL